MLFVVVQKGDLRVNCSRKTMQINKGASLVIVIAIMALFMTLSTSILIAAHSISESLSNDYDADATNLYVNSVYKIMRDTVFEQGITAGSTLEFTGFTYEGKEVKACAVMSDYVDKDGIEYTTAGTVDYEVTMPEGTTYVIRCLYELPGGGGIYERSCSGIISTK